MPTLREALREYLRKSEGRRSYKCLESQATTAADWLSSSYGFADPEVESIPVSVVREATQEWYKAGLSPATITKRINCLSAMGVNVEGCRPRKTSPLKWWLNPEDHKRVTAWLRGEAATHKLTDQMPGILDPGPLVVRDALLVADFIDWTVYTGLRVEESLALEWRHVGQALHATVTVPGTKTANSQATLPLSVEAARVVEARWEQDQGEQAPSARVFPISYEHLRDAWQQCREFLGVSEVPTATLKALRRSFARHATVKGMPLPMLQAYLRHDDHETTMGYLRLVGGYNEDEMRRYL